MIDTSLTLLPFLIADVVNPVLFAFMVYAAGASRPVLNSSMVLLGHTLAYFIVGIMVSSGLEQVADYLSKPQTIDYVLGFVIGVLLIWVAFISNKKTENKKTKSENSLTAMKSLGLGAFINFVGAPFALPYFAAIDQILKANLVTYDALLLLIAYNLLYAIPFLVIPGLVIVNKERSAAILQRINFLLEKISRFLMPIILITVGLVLVVDAVLYFNSGQGLF